MSRAPKSGKLADLTIHELEVMSGEFDQEFVADTFKPMSAPEKRKWQRVKRKPGRPKVGAGSVAIAVTVEAGLLRRVDRLAKKRKTTRAALIRKGLEGVLAASGASSD